MAFLFFYHSLALLPFSVGGIVEWLAPCGEEMGRSMLGHEQGTLATLARFPTKVNV